MAHSRRVVGAKVVVDEDQHLLAREDIVEALQLFGVVQVVGVAPHTLSRALYLLGGEGTTKVGLGLDAVLHQLEVQRAHEARRLAQDGDDARARLDLCYRARGDARPQVGGRGLAPELAGPGLVEERKVVIEWRRDSPRLAR